MNELFILWSESDLKFAIFKLKAWEALNKFNIKFFLYIIIIIIIIYFFQRENNGPSIFKAFQSER